MYDVVYYRIIKLELSIKLRFKMDQKETSNLLASDAGNELELMRKQADIDQDFFTKMWMKLDPFNFAQA